MNIESHTKSICLYFNKNIIEDPNENVDINMFIQYFKKHLLSLPGRDDRKRLFQKCIREIRTQLVLKKLSMVYDPFFFENPSLNSGNRILKIIVHDLRKLV